MECFVEQDICFSAFDNRSWAQRNVLADDGINDDIPRGDGCVCENDGVLENSVWAYGGVWANRCSVIDSHVFTDSNSWSNCGFLTYIG